MIGRVDPAIRSVLSEHHHSSVQCLFPAQVQTALIETVFSLFQAMRISSGTLPKCRLIKHQLAAMLTGVTGMLRIQKLDLMSQYG